MKSNKAILVGQMLVTKCMEAKLKLFQASYLESQEEMTGAIATDDYLAMHDIAVRQLVLASQIDLLKELLRGLE